MSRVTVNAEEAVTEPRIIRGVVREPEPLPVADWVAQASAQYARQRCAPGEYQGPVPVRQLPPGIGGEDLREIAERRLLAGTIWVRGAQRVRVITAGVVWIRFQELTHRKAKRSVHRNAFLRGAHPEGTP